MNGIRAALAWLGPTLLLLAAAPVAAAEDISLRRFDLIEERLADMGSRLAEMNKRLAEFGKRLDQLDEQARNQSSLSLLNQVSTLKADVAKLRGAQEELAHQQQLDEKRQKELYGDLDERLKALANRPPPSEPVRLQPAVTLSSPPAAAAPPPPPQDTEVETKAYEAGLRQFKAASYASAVVTFNAFLKDYPTSALASNALYWLGLSHHSLGDYKSAIGVQKRLLSEHPQSYKVPDSMVSLARALIQEGDNDTARQYLDQVAAKYPASKAAETARKLLAILK